MSEKIKVTEVANSLNKESEFLSQYQIIYQCFLSPMTMLDASLETGIFRANICRYVAVMRSKGIIQIIRKDYDQHTKFKAAYYTTNKRFFKAPAIQLSLWEENLC